MEKKMQSSKLTFLPKWNVLPAIAKAAAGFGIAVVAGAIVLNSGITVSAADNAEPERIPAFWPSAFQAEEYSEPAFADSADRTNNAFNVQDFGEQGTNGWFYRYGKSKAPWKSKRITQFDGEKYYQPGANGLEIKSNFLHTSQAASPILEWRAAQDGVVDVDVTYVKNVNGDSNPSYPDGVQLLIYKGEELLAVENVDISTTEETLAQIPLRQLDVNKHESLYFVVDPRTNNAFDGGSLYISINEANPSAVVTGDENRLITNESNNVRDFGAQGHNGWYYMYGNTPADCKMVSNEKDGEYVNSTSPSLTISKDFIHPAINDNAVLCWAPAYNGHIDLRMKYTKFEQHDGNPDFPDGVTVKVYLNDNELYSEHVDAPASGENKLKFRTGKIFVRTTDRLYFMVDAEDNASYDGGAFNISILDVTGSMDEHSIKVDETSEIRQNFANPKYDFGPQGSNGWFFQSGYEDCPFGAFNVKYYSEAKSRYVERGLEIKSDYVTTGEDGRSPILKWKVAQDGKIKIDASYTKLRNEDANPDWPDGTRVSIYHNNRLLKQEYFAPEVSKAVTKRLDVSSVTVKKGDYITMVINGLENNAYDAGNFKFQISPISGLVGENELFVKPWYDGERTNFASTMDDFGEQGYNGWYYQYGYNNDPFCAVNILDCENNERYYTSDGAEIKKDYIVPSTKGKNADVKWIAAETGRINIDVEYTKLLNEDANPDWPDGTTVYLMRNNTVLKSRHFYPLTQIEVTKSLSVDNVWVRRGDRITLIVDPGKNGAYDGGKYMFVIEDADKVPQVHAGDNDNNTSLSGLESMEQGTDGWWFLEGTHPANAKVLTKQNAGGNGYASRRTDGLEMQKGFVHTGVTRDPIYQWVVGEDGSIDVTGSYMKYGHEDGNPDYPDGVTLKIWKNQKLIYSEKVDVLQGDGNNNVVAFSFDKMDVKRGDKLSFQICADDNNAWDGGQLSVAIEPSSTVVPTPGDDNNSVLGNLTSVEQGTDGWWFMEGTSIGNAKPLTNLNAEKTAYTSLKDTGLEVKNGYVHPGSVQNPIYQWVVAEDGNLDLQGSYTKYGQNDANPDYPDGITLTIYQNSDQIYQKNVKALKGDGNDNTVEFSFEQLEVHRGDIFSFQISPNNNNAWDAGNLSVIFGEPPVTPEPDKDEDYVPDPDRTNNASLKDDFGAQGSNGWFYGMCDWDSKNFSKLPYDAGNNRYFNDGKPELKDEFVEPGGGKNAAYKWIAAQDGTIRVTGEYVKFANADDPSADGTCVRIFVNGVEKKWMGTIGNFSTEQKVTFDQEFTVKAGDALIFAVNPESNDSYDGGRLSVTISEKKAPVPARSNNTTLAGSFGEQGSDGWFYGMCDWNSKNFEALTYDAENNRYYNDGKPELKSDFVEPGKGRNAAYKWIAAEDGTIQVTGDYVKFANADDPGADGTCVRIFVNGVEKKWLGTIGNFSDEQKVTFDEEYTVQAGDELVFAVNPEGNDSNDGGRLSVTISEKKAPVPARSNNTTLAGSFGEQGSDGWFYGMCDWNSKNFEALTYDAENNRYYNDGKPELKSNFVEPGNGRNAAYKWFAAKDGYIEVSGEYVKFANSEDSSADGTCVRIFVNGVEKKWLGTIGNFSDEQKVTFDEVYKIEAGDDLTFAVNPEDNDSYDGGRLVVTIKSISEEEFEEKSISSLELEDELEDVVEMPGENIGEESDQESGAESIEKPEQKPEVNPEEKTEPGTGEGSEGGSKEETGEEPKQEPEKEPEKEVPSENPIQKEPEKKSAEELIQELKEENEEEVDA